MIKTGVQTVNRHIDSHTDTQTHRLTDIKVTTEGHTIFSNDIFYLQTVMIIDGTICIVQFQR